MKVFIFDNSMVSGDRIAKLASCNKDIKIIGFGNNADEAMQIKEVCEKHDVDYHYIQTKNHYQKIQEILLNNALANRIEREWYNLH